MATANEDRLGVIEPDHLYTLQAFTQRLGIRAATVRAARRSGLRVYYAHRLAYIYGQDWIDYIRSQHQSPQEESLAPEISPTAVA